MFERFTDQARRVVVLAQEDARKLNHNYIGTEHLLLGLAREDEGIAAQALARLGITVTAIQDQVTQIVGPGKRAPSGHIPFTPRAKKTLELSLREALQLGHNYIGTEHILLGMLREGDGVAVQVLNRLGASVQTVRQQVIQLIHEAPEAAQETGRETRRSFARAWERAPILGQLQAINDRLAAIERHLGIARDPEGPEDQDKGEEKAEP